jgi:hypothetical protein
VRELTFPVVSFSKLKNLFKPWQCRVGKAVEKFCSAIALRQWYLLKSFGFLPPGSGLRQSALARGILGVYNSSSLHNGDHLFGCTALFYVMDCHVTDAPFFAFSTLVLDTCSFVALRSVMKMAKM